MEIGKLGTGGLGFPMEMPQPPGKLNIFIYTIDWAITYR